MNFYLQNICSIADPKENIQMLEGIPKWRRDKILRYIKAEDRKLSYAAWRLLERVLPLNGGNICDVSVGENGKLKCVNVQFSLSHSGDFVLCVVGKKDIGCDIERVEKFPPEVAEHCFTARERQYAYSAESEEERNLRFYKLWTIKESYLKMTGEGLQVPAECIEVDAVNMKLYRNNTPTPCRLQSLKITNYTLSICEQK
jgi:4'-phosphopantetheinyl transferase